MDARNPRFNPRRQDGAALLVGLIILAVVMLLGITAMGTTVLQERMTGSQRNESLAFAGSESALRGAEQYLWDQFAKGDGRDPNGIYAALPIDDTGKVAVFTGSRDWQSTGGTAYTAIDYAAIAKTAGGSRLDRNPMYMIEKLGPAAGCPLESHSCAGGNEGGGGIGLATYFRVTARSTGGDPRVVRTTESVYAVAR